MYQLDEHGGQDRRLFEFDPRFRAVDRFDEIAFCSGSWGSGSAAFFVKSITIKIARRVG